MITVSLAKYLKDLGLVTFDLVGADGNCYVEELPDEPDRAVALYSSGGNPVPNGGTDNHDEPTVQVKVRGDIGDPREPFARASEIYSALVGLHNVTLDSGGDDEVWINRLLAIQSAPFSIGTDEKGRHEYIMNFAIHVRNTTTNRPPMGGGLPT